MSILASTARAALAGATGTLGMDLLWYSRFRRGGGTDGFAGWELSTQVDSWDDAPAPAQVGRLLAERVLGRDLPVSRATLVNNVMHWGYGTGWGTACGLVATRLPGPAWRGPAFGAFVWASDYVVLPLLGVYRPIWTYDRKTLAQDLSAHMVYGTVTDAALRVLARAA